MSETSMYLHVYENRVWIESDILGCKHVMIQSDAPGMEPFTYCTFPYDHRYTCNGIQLSKAEEVAVSLGAKLPIEHRHRELPRGTRVVSEIDKRLAGKLRLISKLDRIEFALRDAGFGYDQAFEIARNTMRYEWLKHTSPMGWPARIISDETLDADGFDREIDKAMEESEWTDGITE